MKPPIGFSWKGNTDDEVGEARFTVGEIFVVIPLANFKEAYALNDLLIEAYHRGAKAGIAEVSSVVQTALNNAHFRY